MYCLEVDDIDGKTLLKKYNKTNQFKTLINCFIRLDNFVNKKSLKNYSYYIYNLEKDMYRFYIYGIVENGKIQVRLVNKSNEKRLLKSFLQGRLNIEKRLKHYCKIEI